MNWLDRAVAYVDPERGRKRLANRKVMEMLSRGYEAGRRDHRTQNWRAAGSSANAEIGMDEEVVRNRVRSLVRDNGFAKQIVEAIPDHVIGTGIVGAPTGLKGRTQKIVTQRFADWSGECDFDQDLDLFGLQWAAFNAVAESGAAIIRFRRQQFDSKVTVAPVQLQLLEPDFIDTMKNRNLGDAGMIDRGIEYDRLGRKIAYWLFPHHPGDVAQFRLRSFESERVPANELIHLYDKLRPGQDRGMSVLAPSVMTLRDLDSYFDAELTRKRIESCLAGFITTDGELMLDESGKGGATADDQPVERFQPGMLTRLRPGEAITINQPSHSQGISEFAMMHLREAAAGAGVMYEHATGDFTRTNYSSWRAGHHGFRRRIERKQWHVAVYKMCRPIGLRFTEAARAAGLISAPDFGWRWTPPGFISVDPNKDAEADLKNLRMGKVTLSQLVEERGYDYVEHMMQYADDLKVSDEHLGDGVYFDGDPRKPERGAPTVAEKPDEETEAGGKADAAKPA